MSQQLVKKYKELGEQWLKGANIKDFELTPDNPVSLFGSQVKFLNAKERYCLFSGGYGCGKSLTLLAKLIFQSLFFPNNLILLGRKTLSDLDRTTLPQLFEILPHTWYRHKIKEGSIELFNGSKIILFGLDALQSGNEGDIKKAQQKVKSLNLGGYFIDQLEEIEFDVFESLNARLRRTTTPIRQGNMTCNPANFWLPSDWCGTG